MQFARANYFASGTNGFSGRDRRTMTCYSTLYATAEHYLTDKRDYSVVEALPGMPGDGPYLARCSHTIDILHRSCKIWLIRFGMAT